MLRKRFSRSQLLHFTVNLKVKSDRMEACGGSHFLGRALGEQGHEVRLIRAQYVKPYVKASNSDHIDAEAFAEAVEDQPCVLCRSRVTTNWTYSRCIWCVMLGDAKNGGSQPNLRNFRRERGTTLRKGRRYVDEALPGILADGSSKLVGSRACIARRMKQEL